MVNRAIRFIASKVNVTGLEQETNRSKITGELTVPELSDACRSLAAEGVVLLKNEGGILPIHAGTRVAVFGRTAWDYFAVGYGSGGDVVCPYKKSLMDGLDELGVQVCPSLRQVYDQWRGKKKNVPDEGYWGHWPMSYPEMPLDDNVAEQAAKESDMALVVIGRAAGEDRENLLEKGSYYLTDPEEEMLTKVTRHFDRVCVVMDAGNVVDMGWTERYPGVGAVVYAWQGGMEAGTALADVLTGRVPPSGKLTDTIAKRYEDYPSSGHFGGEKYNEYAEDIYVGYRYFETFCPDKVLYPFGFGLGYTRFEMDAEAWAEGDVLRARVKVTNAGDAAGREVAQGYLRLPQGKLGNPRKVLCAFQKTGLLAPGESETVEFAVDIRDFAPYDDSGVTGHKNCRVLEAGEYVLEIGSSVRDTRDAVTIRLKETRAVGEYTELMAPRNGFRRMVNRDGKAEWEDAPTKEKDLRAQILSHIPKALREGKEPLRFEDVLRDGSLAEAFCAQLTDGELDDITHGQGKMNSCYGPEGNAGAFGGVTEGLRARGLPAAITTDGPSGVRIRFMVGLLPCGTAIASAFDPEAAEKVYSLVALEMAHFGSDVLLAPGMNIHRDPLCGRNFEYYSEDPFLTGKMAAAVVRGIQSTGRGACPKHLCCNNQEKHRNRNDSRVSQRALREIYLKGFETAVKEGHPLCVMTSYNLVNGVWSHYNWELCVQLLRDEWGFDGLVITDWWMQNGESAEFPGLVNDAYRIRGQVDVLMPGENGTPGRPDGSRDTVPAIQKGLLERAEAQACAMRVIRCLIRLEKGKRAFAEGK